MKQARNHRFSNWAQNHNCTAANYFQPENEQELIEIIRNNKKVRMVGTGHSWSAICLSSDTLLNLDHYNKVLQIDKNSLQIKTQAGIKLWQLNLDLDKHGLALQNLGSISEQSLAGAISTATHGTGLNYQILGSQVEEFTLIKPDGEKLNIHKEQDKELFETALVSLGTLGVVSEVTLNVVPAFNLRDKTFVSNFDSVIDHVDEFLTETDHLKLWWFPHIEEVVVYQYSRTNEPVNDSRFRQWLMEELLSVNFYRLFLKIGNIKRDWRRNINKVLVQKFMQPLDRIEKSYKVFNVPKPPLHRETEWAFDLKDAKQILRDYKNLINASNHRINFLQEIRFTKGDNYAMSPAHGRDSLWLGAYNADNFGWDELLLDFEKLAKRYNGRPHWGKEFNIDKEYIKQQYPQFEKFKALKAQFDPDMKFENDYISAIFS